MLVPRPLVCLFFFLFSGFYCFTCTDTKWIEVRFKNNGLDLIEVQDNGGGISPENYEGLGMLPSSTGQIDKEKDIPC